MSADPSIDLVGELCKHATDSQVLRCPLPIISRRCCFFAVAFRPHSNQSHEGCGSDPAAPRERSCDSQNGECGPSSCPTCAGEIAEGWAKTKSRGLARLIRLIQSPLPKVVVFTFVELHFAGLSLAKFPHLFLPTNR